VLARFLFLAAQPEALTFYRLAWPHHPLFQLYPFSTSPAGVAGVDISHVFPFFLIFFFLSIKWHYLPILHLFLPAKPLPFLHSLLDEGLFLESSPLVSLFLVLFYPLEVIFLIMLFPLGSSLRLNPDGASWAALSVPFPAFVIGIIHCFPFSSLVDENCLKFMCKKEFDPFTFPSHFLSHRHDPEPHVAVFLTARDQSLPLKPPS